MFAAVRYRRSRVPVLAAALTLVVALLLFAPPPEAAAETVPVANADGSYDILSFRAIVPPGLSDGDKFRLLFITSNRRQATVTDISVYNTFVQGFAARGHDDIRPYSSAFRVVGSTADVDARVNTDMWDSANSIWKDGSTTATKDSTGIPIYWLKNNPDQKVADSYADFYDDRWDHDTERWETGIAPSAGRRYFVYTGAQNDGTKHTTNYLGAEKVSRRWSYRHENPLGESRALKTDWGHFYALSPVFVVKTPDKPVLTIQLLEGEGSVKNGSIEEGGYANFRIVSDRHPTETLANIEVEVTESAGSHFVRPEDAGLRHADINPLPGSKYYDFSVETVNDITKEPNGAVMVELKPGDDYILGLKTSATVRVTDNDPVTVPVDWALTPPSLSAGPGDEFRLLFVTSDKTTATSGSIGVYNTKVQNAAANGHASIRPYGNYFRAVGCAADGVTARVNTSMGSNDSQTFKDGSTHDTRGVPHITTYWLGTDDRVVQSYAHFYSSSGWNNMDRATEEDGGSHTIIGGGYWTGCLERGVIHYMGGWLGWTRPNGVFAGSLEPVTASLTTYDAPIEGGGRQLHTNQKHLYAMSPVFVVDPLTISANAPSIVEGNAATFTLTLNPAPAAPVVIAVDVADGGSYANAGQTGRRTVTVNTSGTATLTVTTQDDAVSEASSQITVTADTLIDDTVGSAASASVTVTDND